MNIFRTLFFATVFLSINALSMEAPVQSRTLDDLRKICQFYGVDLAAYYASTDEEVDGLCQSLKTKKALAGEAIELGMDLLKTVVALEITGAQKGDTMWWRYSNGIDHDIATGKNKSFGRTLLAGFIHDGISHFKDGVLGFDTACTFIYWVNCRYFASLVFDDMLKFLADIENFMNENGFQFSFISTDNFDNMRASYELAKSGSALDFFSNEEFETKEKKFQKLMLRLIIEIQKHSNYDQLKHRLKIERLYTAYQKAFHKNFSYIEKAISGELFMLPMNLKEEQDYLRDGWNKDVVSLQREVFERGEAFHPRLSSAQLAASQDRLISVYGKGHLIESAQLIEEFNANEKTGRCIN
jgi:hypothetical protein